MKINVKDKEKIEKAIQEIEGRATARTLTYEDVEYWMEKLEEWVSSLMPKAYWKGLRAVVDDHAQNFPASYKYEPLSTVFTVERFSTGWFITNICRERTAGEGKEIQIKTTEKQDDAIVKYVTSFKNRRK